MPGRGFDVAVVGHVQCAELQLAVFAPGDLAATAVAHLPIDLPALEDRITGDRQGYVQVARVRMRRGRLNAKAEHREQARISQQGVQRLLPVFHPQRGGGQGRGVQERRHRGADDTPRRISCRSARLRQRGGGIVGG